MLLIILLFIAIVFGIYFYLLKSKNNTIIKLYKSKPILTNNEIEFFNRLKESLPNHLIFPQVSLGAIITPNISNKDRKQYYSIRGTFAQKIADFVICDNNLNVVAVVELDDKTHIKEKDQKRDNMLAQAGYKTIRWQSKNKPSIEEIHKIITDIK